MQITLLYTTSINGSLIFFSAEITKLCSVNKSLVFSICVFFLFCTKWWSNQQLLSFLFSLFSSHFCCYDNSGDHLLMEFHLYKINFTQSRFFSFIMSMVIYIPLQGVGERLFSHNEVKLTVQDNKHLKLISIFETEFTLIQKIFEHNFCALISYGNRKKGFLTPEQTLTSSLWKQL